MRKIRITVLALALAALCTATALAAGTQAVGDVNGSGDVNMTDMQCLYELLSTDKYSGSLTDEAGRRAADINGDGTVDILDYQRLYDILRQQVDYDNPVYEYDENGRMIRKCYYDATGKVNRYLVYEYGADGRKSAAVYYNADGSVRYNCKIEYRADDWAEWTYYDPETNKVLGVDMDDANGVLRQSTEYDPATGKVACVWEYDETGTLRKSTEYDTDTDKAVFMREFDEKERMVDCKGYENGTLSFHWTAVYDEDGIETRTYYDPATENVTWVEKYDEQGRTIDCKRYDGGVLSFHWTAVYDENGAEIRTYYNVATDEISSTEKREYDWTNKTCTITQYDVQTGEMYCVRVLDMSGEGDWKLIKTTDYGKVVRVWEYDEQGRKIDYKEYNGDEVSYHWTAVYDEDGIETRTYYDPATENVTWVEKYDEQGRTIDCKRYDGGVLSFHWTAVYDENGAEIRTYYNVATDEISSTEKREYDWTNKTCTITQYDVQTGEMYCVRVLDMSGEDDWKLLKETYYDENGNVTSETVY